MAKVNQEQPHTPAQGDVPASSPQRRTTLLIAIIVAVIVVVIAAGTIGIVTLRQNTSTTTTITPAGATTGTANGVAMFVDSPNNPGQTDSLSISVNGLAAPPAGSHYYAWILNDQLQQ